MELTKEREQEIADMANAEWVHSIPDNIPYNDPQIEALELEWDKKALNFCKHNTNPLELHAFANLFNWDQGSDLLLDIVRNPNCDFGTAKLIFWRAQPDYYQVFADRADVPTVNFEGWDFIRSVLNVCEGRNFKTSKIAYDPKTDFCEPAPTSKAKWDIPEKFF